ncbi:MAG TPA: Fic family protein, partial [Agitococcus sp.]|nr:Fic family protein [Agitococcus sp.]
LANNLLSNPMAGGALRSIAVGISHTVYQPLAVPALIEEYFELILKKVAQIIDPFEQAFFLMVHLPYLQPFEDVNKRVSRLAANISLIKHNLCPLSFVDVPEKPYIDGLLGVYELNRMELLRDVFVWAYQRSCARYAAIRQSLGEPDPFRLRYRQQIGVIVAEVVGHCLNKKQAIRHIKTYTEQAISRFDQQRFIEVVETELMYLHEGNIARYRLRPSQYALWQKVWQEK